MPNKHMLPQNLYYNYYDPSSKYLIVGYLAPYDLWFRDKAWDFGYEV